MAKGIGTTIALEGEKEFRQAVREIKTDMTLLGSEMKKVTSEFTSNKDSVEALTAKGKVLEKQLEAQTDRVNVLKKAMQGSADQYGENDKKTKDWQIQLNNAEADLNKLSDELKNNKGQLEKAINPTDDLGKEIKQMGDNAEKSGTQSLKMGDIIKANLTSSVIIGGIKTLAGAFVDLGKKAFTAVTNVVDAAGEIDDGAKKVGMSAEEYQKWTYAAKMAGIEQGTLSGLMIKQQTAFSNATDGAKIQSEAYQKLKIDIKSMTAADGFNAVLKGLSEVSDETERNSIANDIFGKTYAELLPLLAEGADGMDALKQEAQDLGGVMSDDTVEAGAKLGDSMDQVKTMLDGVTVAIVEELMPEFQEMADWIVDNKDEIKKLATDTFQKVVDVIGWISENGETLVGVLGGLLTGFIALKAIEAVTVIMGAFNAVMLLNPIAAVTTALALLAIGIVAIIANWDDITAAIKRAWDWLKMWNKTEVDDKTKAIANSKKAAGDGSGGGFTGGGTPSQTSRKINGAFAVGSKYLPKDMLAMVHEGEMIVPKSENPYANSGGKIMPTGGVNITGNNFIINNEMDIEYVAQELAFRTQRQLGGGGLAYA